MADPNPKKPNPSIGLQPGWNKVIERSSGVFGAPVVGDYGTSKYDSYKTYVDPVKEDFEAVDFKDAYSKKLSLLQSYRDAEQPWTDKLGNGIAKFGGSFAEGMISGVGTIYGLMSMPFTWKEKGASSVWDNPITKAAADISDWTGENFRNYRSLSEQNASPWSPDHWATWNFITDTLIGNMGYAASAWVTGLGVEGMLSKLTPIVLAGRTAELLKAAQTGAEELAAAFKSLDTATNLWNTGKMLTSTMFAAAGEASTEAIHAVREFKQKKIDELAKTYGGEENIPEVLLKRLDEEAMHVGNQTYLPNLILLTATNTFEFGHTLMPGRTLVDKAAMSNARLIGTDILGRYAEDAAEQGAKGYLKRTMRSLGSGLKNNLSESFEEGSQYIISEGAKNYHSRKFDTNGQAGVDDMLDGYMQGAHDLFNTQEGVANLMAGFATGGLMPHSWRAMKEAVMATDRKATVQHQLDSLNGLDVKGTMKQAYEHAVRTASLTADLDKAIKNGNEFEVRNIKNDLMKSYVQSRIEAGRYDLLEKELDTMMKMDEKDFRETFGIEGEGKIDHRQLLTEYKSKAKDMQKNYRMLERLFQPYLYKGFSDKNDDEKKRIVDHMNGYKEMAWSLLMDGKDADRRLQSLRKEVDQSLGGLVSLSSIFAEKTKSRKLNEQIKEYNTLAVEQKINQAIDPDYENKQEAKDLADLLKRIKRNIKSHATRNKQSLGLPEYIQEGEEHFMDEYLFDVEKQLDNVPNDRIFEQSLLRGDGSLVDTRQLGQKVNDLRRLEQRRMLAVKGYNNLLTMIREGKYRDSYVRNPNYDKENPDSPEFIANPELLKGDHYKEFEDERDKYYKEKRQDVEQNMTEMNAFAKDLKSMKGRKSQHPQAQAYKDGVKKYTHGDNNTKGFRSMEDDELQQAVEDLNRENMRKSYNRHFDYSSKQARDNFKMDEFVDTEAKTDALNKELKRRRKQLLNKWQQHGREMATRYEDIFNKAGEEAAERFYQQGEQQEQADAWAVIKPILDEKRKELGVIGKQQEPEEPEEAEDPEEAPDAPEESADLSGKEPVNPPASTLFPGGIEPDPKQNPGTKEEIELENRRKETQDRDNTYLLVRRSDLKTQLVSDVYQIKTMDSVSAGTELIIQGKEWTVKSIDKTNLVMVDKAGTERKTITTIVADLAKEGHVEKVIRYKTNQYQDGKVQTNQFNGDLYDPKSPVSLTSGREIKLQREWKKSDGSVGVRLFVKHDKTGNWVDTEMTWSVDPEGVAKKFGSKSKVSKERIQQIQDELSRLKAELQTKQALLGTITNEAGGLGSLIFNEGKAGERIPQGIGEAFGIEFLNNRSVTGGVLLGVLNEDGKTNAQVMIRNEKGNTFQPVTDHYDVAVPDGLINALTKEGNKAGQAVALLPTGNYEGKKQTYMPVMLHTRQMDRDISGTMQRRDESGNTTGKAMTVGEAMIDVMLNPGKPEYASQMKALFDAAGLDWNNGSPDWNEFYDNQVLFNLMNRVFFAGAQEEGGGINQQAARYKYPFTFFANRTKEGRLYVTVDLTGSKGARSNRKKVNIFLQNEDGTWNTKPVAQRVRESLDDADPEAQKKLDMTLSYDEILDQVRAKPYRVDVGLISQPASTSKPFQAIEFNAEGELTTKTYPTYLHYASEKQLLETTVQGIKQGGRQFFFVNKPISYAVNYGQKEEVVKTTTPVKNKEKQEGSETTTPPPSVSSELQTALTNLETWKQKEYEKNKDIAKSGPFTEAMLNTATDEQFEQAKEQLERQFGGMKRATKFTGGLAAGIAKRKGQIGGKAMLDFDSIKSVTQYTVPGLEQPISEMAEQVNQEMVDMLLDAFATNTGKVTFSKKKLKGMLNARLIQRYQTYRDAYKEAEAAGNEDAANAYYDRMEALDFALTHFDMADFESLQEWNGMSAEEHKEFFTLRKDPETGKRDYFVGFFNLALTELFKNKVIDPVSRGKEYLTWDEQDPMSATMHYDSNWSVKVDPRNSLSKWARLVMMRVPEQVAQGDGTFADAKGSFGLVKRMDYESVHKALITTAGVTMLPHEFYDFIESIPGDPALSSNPSLIGVYKYLQEIKAIGGQDAYVQVIHQVFNPVLLQQADYTIMETTVKSGKTAEDKIYNASRQMINDEILSRWSQGFRKLVQQGRFIEPVQMQGDDGIITTEYRQKPLEYKGTPASLSDYIKLKLREAFDETDKEQRYKKVAAVYVNDLNFPLSNDGTVEGTADVLKSWDKKVGKKKDELLAARFFKDIVQSNKLQSIVEHTLVDLIAKPIENQLATPDRPSTFNPDEPLSQSTGVLNAYAKALKGHFQDVVNATLTDINNKNRYLYIPRNNLSEQMLKAKRLDYMWQVANTHYGRYMPMISDIFQTDAKGNLIDIETTTLSGWQEWQKLRMDYMGGIKKNKYRTTEASNATLDEHAYMTLKAFQNQESHKTKGDRTGQKGRYMMVNGDAGTSVYYEAPKYNFGLKMVQRADGGYAISVLDEVDTKNGVSQIGQAREMLYRVFKSEVNRSVESFARFQHYSKLKKGRLNRMKRELRPGIDYVLDKAGNIHMGSAASISGFDQHVYNMMMQEDSPLFLTANGRVTDIRPEVSTNGKLNDEYLRQVFDTFGDDFITRLVDAKMQQVKFMMKELLELEFEHTKDGKLKVTGYRFKGMNYEYAEAFRGMVGADKGVRFMVQQRDGISPLQTIAKSERNEEDGRRYDTEEDAYKHSYGALMVRAMLADQQINHFITMSMMSAVNGTDPVLYQKEGKVDYKSLFDNWTKRAKGVVGPKLQTLRSADEKTYVITYEDPVNKNLRTTISKVGREAMEKHPTQGRLRKAILEFLLNTPVNEKGEKLATIDEKGTISLPMRIIGHQQEVMFGLRESEWNGRKDSDPVKQNFVRDLMLYMDAKPTDGGSVITLREYLHRQYKEGKIKSEQEFNDLYDYYHNPDLSMTDQDFKEKLPLVGLKYIQSGVDIKGQDQHRIYGKDSETVLLPAITKGSEMDKVREHMEAIEGKQPGIRPGVALKPRSTIKLGVMNPVELWDTQGKYTGVLADHQATAWNSDVQGTQVRNPDKHSNETTTSSQATRNKYVDIPSYVVFGREHFEEEKQTGGMSLSDMFDIIEEGGVAASELHLKTLQRMGKGKPYAAGDKMMKYGKTARETMRMEYRLVYEQMRRDLQGLLNQWGIKVESKGEEYLNALKEAGLPHDATPKQISAVFKEDDPVKKEAAYRAHRLRGQYTVSNLDKFLSDVTNQLITQKGLSVNGTFLLKQRVGEFANQLELPITFNNNSAYIQSVILSRINAVITGKKLPGKSFVQSSSFGFGKGQLQGSEDLKGYTPLYNEKGEVVGANPAEVAIPWRFTDPKTGKLLDFTKYCNPDGTPKLTDDQGNDLGLWDKSMLQLIGLRIPNTGVNTMGYYKVVRFLPGLKDVAQVPMEVLAQMNSDLDFDKFVTYIYNHQMQGDRISKVEGFMDETQKKAKSLLNDENSITRAVRYDLEANNEDYKTMADRVDGELNSRIKVYGEDLLDQMNEVLEEDETAYTMEDLLSMERSEKLAMLEHRIGKDVLEGLQHDIANIERIESAARDSFNIDEFISETPDFFMVLQSKKQLENAQIDIYHMMLREPTVLRRMLKPLTTDTIKDQITSTLYRGQSLEALNDQDKVYSPFAEVSQTDTKGSSGGADQIIGIMANFGSFIHYAQIADLALGNEGGLPIYFGEKKGDSVVPIEEEEYDKEVFPVIKKQFDKTAMETVTDEETGEEHQVYRGMTYTDAEGKTWKVPYRYGRITGRGLNGRRVGVNEMAQSILQAALDNFNDPILGKAGISDAVINELQVMLLLGYVDHAIPFINQPAIREYVKIKAATKGVVSDSTFEKEMNKLVDRYLRNTGSSLQAVKDELDKMAEDSQEGVDTRPLYRQVLEYVGTQNQSPLTIEKLADNVAMPASERTTAFYKDQLWVLEMMMRLGDRGDYNLQAQLNTNVDAKGIKGTTFVEAVDQLEGYKKVKDLPIINVHRMTSSSYGAFVSNAAMQHGLQFTEDLVRYGTLKNIIQDLDEAFTRLRDGASGFNRRWNSAATKKQINIAIVQYVWSNPELYRQLLEGTDGSAAVSAHELRQFLMQEQYATNKTTDGEELDLERNAAHTLSNDLLKLMEGADKEGEPYRNQYDILNNLRPVQQPNNERPSVVLYQNANNYKKRQDVLIPLSIVRMMESEDETVRQTAKKLLLYPFINGGVNNPISYVSNIPAELMVEYGITDRLNRTMDELNKAIAATFTEAKGLMKDANDERSFLEKVLSGDYNQVHTRGLGVLQSFITQYYQHNPFDLADRYILDSGVEMNDTNPDEVTFEMDETPYLVMVPSEEGAPRLFRHNGDGTYQQLDMLASGYNNVQYNYNEKGDAGFTMVNALRSNPLAVPNAPKFTKKQKHETETLPYRLRTNDGPIKEDYQAPFGNILSWVANDAHAMMDMHPTNARVKEVQSSLLAIIDYIAPKVPETMLFKVDTTLKKNAGKMANMVWNGVTGVVSYDPLSVNRANGSTESSDFKYLMMHEALHATGGRAIGYLEKLIKGELTEKEAAKALKVRVGEVKDMRAAYEDLQKMITAEKLEDGRSFKQALLEEWYQVKLADLGPDGSRNSVQARQLEEGLKKRVAYVTGDAEEFLAYMISDNDFRKALNNINYTGDRKNKTVWEKLLDLFKELLGIREGSALEEGFYNLMRVLDPVKPVNAAQMDKGLNSVITGSSEVTREKAMPAFETTPPVETVFTEALHDTLPFPVDLQEAVERYNFKQTSC